MDMLTGWTRQVVEYRWQALKCLAIEIRRAGHIVRPNVQHGSRIEYQRFSSYAQVVPRQHSDTRPSRPQLYVSHNHAHSPSLVSKLSSEEIGE